MKQVEVNDLQGALRHNTTHQGAKIINKLKLFLMVSGCGSVGRAVASDARGPQFKSSYWQTFISDIYLFTVNSIEKTKIKIKIGHDWPMFKTVSNFTHYADVIYYFSKFPLANSLIR